MISMIQITEGASPEDDSQRTHSYFAAQPGETGRP